MIASLTKNTRIKSERMEGGTKQPLKRRMEIQWKVTRGPRDRYLDAEARGDRGSRRHRCLCWPSANACLSMWNTCACSTLPRYFRTSNKKRATNPSVDTANFANEFDDGAATPLVWSPLVERAFVKRTVHFYSIKYSSTSRILRIDRASRINEPELRDWKPSRKIVNEES